MKLKNMEPTSQNHEYQKLIKRLWSKRRPFPEVDQMAVKRETKFLNELQQIKFNVQFTKWIVFIICKYPKHGMLF